MGKYYTGIKKIVKILGYIVGVILLIPLLMLIALQIPSVQHFALKEITQNISNKLHTRVSLKKVSIGFLKRIELKEIYIEGQEKDTLFYAQKLEVDIDLFHLINKKISISDIKLEQAHANIYRNSGSTDFNYAFIINAFSDTTSKTPSTWTFDLKGIHLNRVKLDYKDIPGGTHVKSKLTALKVDFKNLGLEDQKLVIRNADISGLMLALNFTNPEVQAQKQDTSQTSSLWTIIEEASVKNSFLVFNNYTQKAVARGLDYNRLSLRNINGSFQDLQIHGSDFATTINELSLKEKSGLDLHALTGRMNIQSSGITLELKKMETKNSHLDHHVSMYIPSGKENGIGEMSVNGNLKDEEIAFDDMLYFIPDLDSLEMLKDKKVSLSGKISGKIKALSINNLKLAIDGQAAVKADIVAKGLPDLKAAYFDLQIKEIYVNAAFAAAFIPEKETKTYLCSLGSIHLNGSIKGHAISPTARLNINTDAGSVKANVRFNTDALFKLKGYTGQVSSNKLDLGRILGDTSLGKLTMIASAQGYGKNINSFTVDIKAFRFNHYIYQGLQMTGNMLNKVVQTDFVSKDSNLITSLKLYGDLNTSTFKVSGDIKKADLFAMHFMPSPFMLKTQIEVAVQGSNIDSITGTLKLNKVTLANETHTYDLDSLLAQSTLKNGIHEFLFNSPVAMGNISGKFSISELKDLFSYIQSTYYNSSIPLPDLPHTNSVALNLKAGNVSSIMQLFIPGLTMLDSINISGTFRKKEGILNLRSSVRSLTYGENQLKGIYFNADGLGKKVNFSSGIQSLMSGKNVNLNKLIASGSISKEKSDFNIKLYDQKAPTRFNMDGTMYIQNDTSYLNFPSAQIFIKGKEWNFNKGNRIVYAKNYITINNLELTQGDQMITVNTRVAGKSGIAVGVFQKVHLNELADLVGVSSYKLSGTLNGKAEITDMLSSQGIQADLHIDTLAMNNEKIGNVNFVASKEKGSDLIFLNMDLAGGENKISIKGNYSMGKESNMNLAIDITKLSLHPFEPLTKVFAYRLNGSISANLQVAGKSGSPLLTGDLLFNEHTEVGLTVVHTTYSVSGQQIIFNESSIQFNNFILLDSLNNQAVAKGFIYHDHFDKIRFNMFFDTDNFQLVNNEYTPDASFYGKLFVKMNVGISGLIDNLKIRFDVLTKDRTRLYIPLASKQTGTVMPSYVHFNEIEPEQDWSSSKSIQDKPKADPANIKTPKIDLSKFDITGHIRFTKDAELNIIVDPVNGDKISAKGNGAFSVDFNSQNEINIYGTYTIDTGNYKFSFVNLVKKDFKIQKGSSISWAGDPEDATLNINAIYKTKASRYELIQDQTDFMTSDQIAASKRLLPVEVYLNLTGSLLTPVINFDIKVPEGGDPLSGNMVVQKIDQIKNDPNELTKQVFSLIVLNKFMTQSGSTGGNSAGNVALNEANQSVSKALNSQLNQLSDDYLKGISLNVNLQSLDQSYGPFAQNATITATKQINSRISVSAGGNVNLNSNNNSGQFAGDYNIYYRVNPGGTINMKFFRTSQQTIYSNNLYTQQGFSGTYRMEFNRRGDLFRKKSNRKSSNIKKDSQSRN
jgi:translocation and assembly module TamB